MMRHILSGCGCDNWSREYAWKLVRFFELDDKELRHVCETIDCLENWSAYKKEEWPAKDVEWVLSKKDRVDLKTLYDEVTELCRGRIKVTNGFLRDCLIKKGERHKRVRDFLVEKLLDVQPASTPKGTGEAIWSLDPIVAVTYLTNLGYEPLVARIYVKGVQK